MPPSPPRPAKAAPTPHSKPSTSSAQPLSTPTAALPKAAALPKVTIPSNPSTRRVAPSVATPSKAATLPKVATAPKFKLRPFFLSLSVAAIAATGAWYGASLKDSTTSYQETKKSRAAPPTERIAHLEQRRAAMTSVKNGLEAKISELRSRQRERNAERKGD